MIPVTRTFLPPLYEYHDYLQKVWNSNQITNGGEFWYQLQGEIREYLHCTNLILTSNGTVPIQIALQNLACKGEVITTPFSYVATTASIVWESCVPVYVDIHPEYLTIDETKIEAAITERTTAILATHVFGNACNVEEIKRIAEKNNLKVIYDAAHCFGVTYKDKSIFDYGDVSTCSFHATKIFHTGEGGAMFCKNPLLYQELFSSHNFGHQAENEFSGVGINAKMSELQAALGLAVLPYVEENIFSRRTIVEQYLDQLDSNKIKTLRLRKGTNWNYSYFPVLFNDEFELLRALDSLNREQIFPRRYFYPSLNKLDYIIEAEPMPVSENVTKRILCLPLYNGLKPEEIQKVVQIVNSVV